ncbi:MAG: hypothetical protein GY757_54860, partial [bacterium]|nr:hypothetical protein [bacterium]
MDAFVGIDGLDEVGDALIKKFMPEAKDLIAQLEKYVNLGSVLKEKVEEGLDNLLGVGNDSEGDKLKAALVDTLVGNERADKLAEKIGKAVETVLNSKLGLLKNEASVAGEKLLEELAEKLSLPPQLSEKLVDMAKSKMGTLLTTVEEELKDKVTEIITGKGVPVLETLFEPLEKIGETVGNLADDINEISQRLLTPVINFLTKYQEFRAKAVAVVQSAAKLKLALHLGRSLEVTDESSSMLEFILDLSDENNRDKVTELYKEMITGNFKKQDEKKTKTNNESESNKANDSNGIGSSKDTKKNGGNNNI